MKKIINDGFKMWANYVEAIDNFTKGDDEKFGRFMRIICYYGIFGEEIAESEVEKLFFTGIRSSINASVQNVKNGKLGGTKKTASNETDNSFVKPSLEDVKTYCEERKNKIDPAAFIDYYERNGWKVGKSKSPMKDWKASVRIWERNDTSAMASDLHNKNEGDML